VHVLPTDAVDLEAAAQRRRDARAKLESELQRAQSKLANDGFVAKAPEELVAAERDKLDRLRRELEAL
jgi:valyl-tRNA synthetase